MKDTALPRQNIGYDKVKEQKKHSWKKFGKRLIHAHNSQISEKNKINNQQEKGSRKGYTKERKKNTKYQNEIVVFHFKMFREIVIFFSKF